MRFFNRFDMGGGPKPPKIPEQTGLEQEQLSSAEEAVPLPYVAGTQKIAVKWITNTYGQFTKDAPQERPAKK